MSDYTGIVIIGLGILAAAVGVSYLSTPSNVPFIGEDVSAPTRQPWPMEIDDPNIANAYNRAAYRDNTLRADEIYNNPSVNFTNDFLHTYAPTVKQAHIPVQQL